LLHTGSDDVQGKKRGEAMFEATVLRAYRLLILTAASTHLNL